MLSPKFLSPFIAACSALPCAAFSISFLPHCPSQEGSRTWAFEVGVASISSNNIGNFTRASMNLGHGPSSGELYIFTASRRLGELKWNIGGNTFTPQLEFPLTLEIVDENARSPFPDMNASLAMRWIDFPWNQHLKTSFAMGLGFSYSQKIYLMDIERHPGERRSKLKFNWPMQLTFALPKYEEHQLMIFIAHQSGGKIFDEGGVNSLGIGYRFDF